MLSTVFISHTYSQWEYVYGSWQRGAHLNMGAGPNLTEFMELYASLLTFLNMKKYKFLNTSGSKSFRQGLGA